MSTLTELGGIVSLRTSLGDSMHIVALAVGAFVGWLLWTNGQPVWGGVVGLFIASGIWRALPWRLLNPAYVRDAVTFRKAAKAIGFWQGHDADFLRSVLEDWRATKRRTVVSAEDFIVWTQAQVQAFREQRLAADEARRKHGQEEGKRAADPTERAIREAAKRLAGEAWEKAIRDTRDSE